MEDFVDRYDNVYIACPQYRFFIAPDQKYPPYVANSPFNVPYKIF